MASIFVQIKNGWVNRDHVQAVRITVQSDCYNRDKRTWSVGYDLIDGRVASIHDTRESAEAEVTRFLADMVLPDNSVAKMPVEVSPI